MNAGELNELKTKLCLIYLRDNNPNITIGGISLSISSVGLKNTEYKSLPPHITSLQHLRNLNETEITNLARQCKASKAGLFDKADVQINGVGYSIKSLNTAPPALINHTSRDGWEKAGTRINFDITKLDEIVDEYWRLRQAGEIKEDIDNSDPKSPFAPHKEYLKPILNYFLFRGTPRKDSASPAKFMLDIEDPFNTNSWKIYGNDFLDRDNHWEKLIFSLRAKKGMSNYPAITNLKKRNSMARWTMLFQGEYRGALHVRLKR